MTPTFGMWRDDDGWFYPTVKQPGQKKGVIVFHQGTSRPIRYKNRRMAMDVARQWLKQSKEQS